ncbi:MAG: aldehyde dehydrogenase family protein [Actinomycetota bacterium]
MAALSQAVKLSGAAGEPRRQAYGLSMLGPVRLFRGDLDAAAEDLDASIELAERDHWLAFLPWPQALRGEVQLARADLAGAARLLQQAFARACQLGDPCWQGISARGLALVAEAEGDTGRAFALLSDAQARCNRLADPYVWLSGYILDSQCELGVRHGHPDTRSWVEAMRILASRSGMRELTLHSLRHGAALGNAGDGQRDGVRARLVGVLGQAWAAIAARLRAGGTTINSVLTFVGMSSIPFGGVGESGFGRFHGADGLREFSYAKSTTRKRFDLGKDLQSFPRTPDQFDIVRKTLRLRYGRTLH